MYSTCLFCQASLGKNEVIESFPIGRRLAFDSQKGRLWVVCRKCARWNLTPLEERWEAVEECERAFSSTRLRVSTDNVGLARLSEGLELVRIGQPQRPEFAAWRYGDQFGRRRRKYLIFTGTVMAAALGQFIVGPVLGLSLGVAVSGAIGAVQSLGTGASLFQHNRVRGRVAIPGEKRPALVRKSRVDRIRIVSDGDRWGLRLPVDAAAITGPDHGRIVTVEGSAALRAAATILSVTNDSGANQKRVGEAVGILSEKPDPSRLFLDATRRTWKVDPRANAWKLTEEVTDKPGEATLSNLPAEVLLALEMATNEDIERRALEGELAMLEEAWRQADEIAAIVDNLDLGKPGDSPARS